MRINSTIIPACCGASMVLSVDDYTDGGDFIDHLYKSATNNETSNMLLLTDKDCNLRTEAEDNELDSYDLGGGLLLHVKIFE